MTTTATLSALLRTPNEVIDRLDEGDVVLTRRDGESLRLTKESSAADEHEMVSAFAHLIAATALDETMADRMATNLSTPFPWIEFLPANAHRDFVNEFLRTARACASVDRFDRLAVVVANWRETAIVYSLGLDQRLSELDYIPGGTVVPDPRET